MNEPNPNCPGCRYPDLRHRDDCPSVTMEDLRYYLDRRKKSADHWVGHFNRMCKEAQRWEGKFRVVKHENNQLRKKLNARCAATAPEAARDSGQEENRGS